MSGAPPGGPEPPAAADDDPEGHAPPFPGRDRPPAGTPGPSGPSAPSGRPRRRRTVIGRHPYRLLAVVFCLFGAAVLALVLWVESEANPSGPPGAQVVITVPAGSGVGSVASDLERRGVIGSSLAFRIWTRLYGSPVVRPGEYALRRNESFGSVTAVLGAGPNIFSVVIPPGFTVAEVAHRVGEVPGHDQRRFEALATGGTVRSPWEPAGSTNLDGLLGTGSYRVMPGETDAAILTAMIDRFDTEASSVGLASGAARLGLTPYQLVTVASIVEKEGVIQKNLGPVARVILNRLARGMPLQMDSTVLYAEGRDGGTVTTKDLQLQTPYNSYLHTGLTPTPISFPSTAALQAALDPPAGPWLYFVVVEKDGTEAFSTTYAQQQANEKLAATRGLP